jgi:alpha-L-fucosidase
LEEKQMTKDIKTPVGDTSRWVHDRFGMCIFWGLYSLAARHEWVQSREEMSDDEYRKYFDHFYPDLYNPRDWARAAKKAGMKYVLICTKHHDGFCLWDTKTTDFKVTNTPHGKDVLKPMVDAFRAEGLRIFFYYSVIDWHHHEFPVDRHHPMRNNAAYRAETKHRDIRRYVPTMCEQVRELLTEFGHIDMFFPDFSYPGEDGKGRDDWQSEKLVELVRELQPHVILNDRLDLQDFDEGWDFRTPEQVVPRRWPEVDGKRVLWETYQTFSGSWGYHRDEASWKSTKQCIEMLIEAVGKGGNLTLNVGPTARGEFDARATDRLSGIGRWIEYHDRSIYGCTQAPREFRTPENCLLTYNPDLHRLYVHILAWPYKVVHLDGLAGRVRYAQLLHDASEILPFEFDIPSNAPMMGLSEKVLSLALPVVKPEVEVPVIELFLE